MADAADPDLPNDLSVPDGRDRLGRAHQVRVDIAIALVMVPGWIKRALLDRNPVKARGARAEIVERIAIALERRFQITWRDGENDDENARAASSAAPLFGGPDGAAIAEADLLKPVDSPHITEGT